MICRLCLLAMVVVQHAVGFACDGGGGNDAGVVLPHENEPLSDPQRLAVAAEVGFSETVFITSLRRSPEGCELSLRYFTPTAEVELCGHATIACLGLLHERGLLAAHEGVLQTRAGAVRFTIDGASSRFFMQQLEPMIDAPLPAGSIVDVAAALFRSDSAALLHLDETWPPRIASTGLRDLLVALRPGGLAAIDADMPAIAELSRRLGTVGVHAFCKVAAGEGTADYRVRNFAPLFGIDEESATGTSNAALACALWASETVPRRQPLIFSQGEAMGRPSRIAVLPPTSELPVATRHTEVAPSEEIREASLDETRARPWVGGEYYFVASHTYTCTYTYTYIYTYAYVYAYTYAYAGGWRVLLCGVPLSDGGAAHVCPARGGAAHRRRRATQWRTSPDTHDTQGAQSDPPASPWALASASASPPASQSQPASPCPPGW